MAELEARVDIESTPKKAVFRSAAEITAKPIDPLWPEQLAFPETLIAGWGICRNCKRKWNEVHRY